MEPIAVGRVTVQPFEDVPLRGAPKTMFPQVAEEQWEPWKHYFTANGTLQMSATSHLIRADGRTIIVDLGYGEVGRPRPGGGQYPPGPLLTNLEAAGIAPEDVDTVVLSHLHGDHIGWCSVTRDGVRVPAFPRARYVVVREAWTAAADFPESRQKAIRDALDPIEATRQLDLVSVDHTLTDDVALIPLPGHTVGHAGVWIASEGTHAIIVGDAVHHPVQLTEPTWRNWVDEDHEMAIETRKAIIARALEYNALVMGPHFLSPSIGKMVTDGGRVIWQALV